MVIRTSDLGECAAGRLERILGAKSAKERIKLLPELEQAFRNECNVYGVSYCQVEKACSQMDLDDFPAAVNTLTQALQLPVSDDAKGEMFLNRGCAYNNMGMHEQARQDYQKARQNLPVELHPIIAANEAVIGTPPEDMIRHRVVLRKYRRH